MLRSMLYSDSITARAAKYVKDQESEFGPLLDAVAPIGLVVVDVLRAIGLPDNAIMMVIHDDPNLISAVFNCHAPEDDPKSFPSVFEWEGPQAKCAYCEGFATNLIDSSHGPVYACLEHTSRAEELGKLVVA